MLIRVSFLVVASVTALSVSHIKNVSHVKKNNKITSPGSHESQFQYELGEKEIIISNTNHASEEEEEEENETAVRRNAAEIELLQNLVMNYKQRKLNLERKLLELNSLKEEKSVFAQLRRKIDERTSKLDLLNITIDSLQAENKVLQEKLKETVLAEKQLEIAKKMVNGMQRKKDVNESPANKQILIPQQQVNEFQKYECSGGNDLVNKKLKALENIELEVLALKRENKELELEKREVAIKLTTAEEIIKKKEKMVAKIRKEITGLRDVNEELSEQFERLQRNRFDMVQELVYQRWLYTCMRFEANQHKKGSRKASRNDFVQNSENALCKEIEALTSDPELDSISSSNATFGESDEIDITTKPESSSSSQSSSNKSSSLLHRMKRWKRRKDDSKAISPKGGFLKGNSPSRPGLIRRFSMSMVLENQSMPRKNSTDNGNSEIKATQETDKQNYSSKSWASPITPRLKRVSFNDSIKLNHQYMYTCQIHVHLHLQIQVMIMKQ